MQVHAVAPREHAVAKLVATGLTDREVAERLGLSVRTVHYYLSNVRRRMGARNRVEVALIIHGITPGQEG